MPVVKEVLIDERDFYLAAKIWTSTPPEASKRIAAVIGAGHLHGIKNHLEKMAACEETPDVSKLNVIPAPGFLSKLSRFIIPAVIVTIVALGFIRAGTDIGFSMLQQWVLWNGSLAAFGAIIALGHPLAILVSFFGAPITTLNPFIGVGLLSGLVQVSLRKPRVSDVQDIMGDAASLKGWYRNRITRALLVFFLSSLGSSIGTFVSVPIIASLLAK
jgi:pheromone shutdown-related protein TraB